MSETNETVDPIVETAEAIADGSSEDNAGEAVEAIKAAEEAAEAEEQEAEEEETEAEAEPEQEEEKEEEKSPEPKTYTVKVDGKELKVSENELLSGYQRARAAAKRFEEAAQLKKDVETVVGMLKNNPVEVLTKHLGVDMQKVAEEFLSKKMEDEQLTPEEKEKRELQNKLKEYEERERHLKEQQQKEREMQLQQKYEEEYSQKITSALSSVNVPKTPKTLARMAEYMYRALESGYELEPRDVASMVREDYMREINELLGAADEDTVASILGDKIIDKARKAKVKNVKQVQSPLKTQSVAKPAPEKKARRKLSMEEFTSNLLKD